MEAQFAQLAIQSSKGHMVGSKVSIVGGYGLGTAVHSMYCVCEILGKQGSSFQTEAVKSTLAGTGQGRPGTANTTQVAWNYAHSLDSHYEPGDSLNFTVYLKGGILHSLHLTADE